MCTPGILEVWEKSLVERMEGWKRVALKMAEDGRARVDTGARKRGAAVSKDLLKVAALKDMRQTTGRGRV